MKRTVIFSEQADEDVLDIYNFIVSQSRSIEPAKRVLTKLYEKIDFLTEAPATGSIRPELYDDPHIRFWPVYSYLVIYSFTESELTILRIIHASRNLPDHLHPE